MIAEFLEAMNPGHILAEIAMEILSYAIFGVVVGRWVLKRHDRKVHGK